MDQTLLTALGSPFALVRLAPKAPLNASSEKAGGGGWPLAAPPVIFTRSADMLELAMWKVPHKLGREGATDAGWRHPASFSAGRALVVGSCDANLHENFQSMLVSSLLTGALAEALLEGAMGSFRLHRPRVTAASAFFFFDITPWRVSSLLLTDFALPGSWRLTAVEEKNLFIQPLDPSNRQKRSPSLAPPSSALWLLDPLWPLPVMGNQALPQLKSTSPCTDFFRSFHYLTAISLSCSRPVSDPFVIFDPKFLTMIIVL
jgi:hypothetical protein